MSRGKGGAVQRSAAVLFWAGVVLMSLRSHAALYDEPYRPQFHFSARVDWLNDPNGLVFDQGEYHLFSQRTPGSLQGEKKNWGHAVSADLLHWQQLPDAIEMDGYGDIWSGSAVVDWKNTAGLQQGAEPPLIALYTAAGNHFTQCLAYSHDRGRTWTKYAGNPVMPNIHAKNRDPKVVWYEPGQTWVMALYLDRDSDYGLFTSPDLTHWTQIQTVSLAGSAECPDFFPIRLDGDAAKTMWILTGANGRYLVGSFDGKAFKPMQEPRQVEFGANCYAVQTYSDIPPADGRRIQIGWMMDGKYPGMPFNQQMSFPCTLMLRSTADGPRLFKYPVKEIEALHTATHQWKDAALQPNVDLLGGLKGDLLDIAAEIDLGTAKSVAFNIRGAAVTYDATAHRLRNGRDAELQPENNRITLRVLVDRTSIEVFGNDGRVAISTCFVPDLADHSITLKSSGGTARVISLKIDEVKSAWGGE